LSHRPLDYIALMLGTNDLQPRMHDKPFQKEQLAAGLIRLIQIIRALPECGANNQPAKILVIAPPLIKMAKGRPEVSNLYGNETGVALSREFASVYREIAKTYHCGFLDASLYAEAGDADGVHLTKESHLRLGEAVAEALLAMDARADAYLAEPVDRSVLTADIEM
jgi:lysophospholipase L1-like esterase